MGEKGKIGNKATNGKEKGSQFVFWTLQDPADAASPEELVTMDERIAALRANAPMLKTNLKVVGFKLSTLKSAPTMAELAETVEALRVENKEKSAKLLGSWSLMMME
jgi:26S proteasome regulatory subunit (ATPase 3-interacting protein)